MSPMELTSRVTRESGGAVVILALMAFAISAPMAAGVAAGGLLAILNFRGLAGRVISVLGGVPAPGGWVLGFGLRLVGVAAVTAGLMASGVAHPLGVVAGFTVLPCALVWHGLGPARAES